MSKQYGLIISSKKAGGATITRPSIFNDDSDSDSGKAPKPTSSAKTKKQDVLNQQKALEQDPTVYQYDEIYDEMDNKKKESKLARKDIDKKPKYISRLIAAADRRKRENERRIERQVQKEREAEGEEFKDKESFVTSAYKKKLEELKALEEQEKREDYLEAIGDVTKQGNLDGFYRHLYDQKVNYEDKELSIKKEPKSESDKSDQETSSTKRHISDNEEDDKTIKKLGAKKRKYRSRKDASGDSDKADSEAETVEIKKEHLPSNLDADSDFSVDSSSSDEESEKEKTTDKVKSEKTEPKGEKLQLPAKGNVLSDNAALSKKGDESETLVEGKDEKVSQEAVKEDEEKPKKPKIDIWKKRTVGEVFDAAVKRYFERKSARGW